MTSIQATTTANTNTTKAAFDPPLWLCAAAVMATKIGCLSLAAAALRLRTWHVARDVAILTAYTAAFRQPMQW